MEWHVKTICFFITREFPVFPHKWYKVPLELKQTSPASPDVYISEHNYASLMFVIIVSTVYQGCDLEKKYYRSLKL